MNGIQKAHAYGSACPQVALSPVPFASFSTNYTSISEDCKSLAIFRRLAIVDWYRTGLTINVLKPTNVKEGDKLPVAFVSPYVYSLIGY
jgi:hypothetical protein